MMTLRLQALLHSGKKRNLIIKTFFTLLQEAGISCFKGCLILLIFSISNGFKLFYGQAQPKK